MYYTLPIYFWKNYKHYLYKFLRLTQRKMKSIINRMAEKTKIINRFISLSIGIAILWIALTIFLFPSPSNQTIFAVPQQGFYAPDFTLSTLDGKFIQLSDLQGKAVLVNIWASWCTPCQAEMPAIQAISEKYTDDDFVVLAVNATSQDNLDNVIKFVDSQQLTFPILLDLEGTTTQTYQVQALPSSFFITPEGIINEIVIGGPMSEALLETRVLALLGR